MKKIMSVLIGLSLVLGAASISFAQGDTTKTTKAKKTKAKKGGTTDTSKKTS